MSWISVHPDELDPLGKDPSEIIGPQVEGNDGENTFYYPRDTLGSGYDNELTIGFDIPVERGVSYSELRKMTRLDDDILSKYIDEEQADDDEDRFEDRDDYQSNTDMIVEGRDIFNTELKKYNKAHNIKKQSITYSDYP